MTKRTITTLILFYPVFFLNEVYKDFSGEKIDPWLNYSYPISKDWFVKFLSIELTMLITAIIMVRLTRGKDLMIKAAAWVWLVFRFHEMFRFFLDFNRGGYLLIYLAIPVAIFIVAYLISIEKWNWQKLRMKSRKLWTREFKTQVEQ